MKRTLIIDDITTVEDLREYLDTLDKDYLVFIGKGYDDVCEITEVMEIGVDKPYVQFIGKGE